MTSEQTTRGGEIAFEWWCAMNAPDSGQSGSSRAAMARLRRASTPVDVMLEPAALRLMTRLPRTPRDRVAILAGVLAWIREVDEARVARAIGRTALGDDHSALLSESRFRRLLQSQQHELLDSMRRLVRQMKGRANVGDLADAILYWGDSVKKKWIFDYYCVASASPSAEAAADQTRNSQQDPTND